MKKLRYLITLGCICCCATATVTTFTSCDDMLDMGNSDVLYADENHLTQASDTVNSFIGILAQLQKIGVRTNLFGELRADLVEVAPTAKMSLKEIADFAVTDDNEYNSPRDYYAIINNCNYYLANADTALIEQKNNNGARQDFYPFRAEYYAVRAIRAWVYLQLGQIYGSVPVVTEPMLTLEEASVANAKTMDLAAICDYFINDLKPFADMARFAYPYHGNPGHAGYNGHTPSRLSVYPVALVLGDLYLWAASIRQDPMLAREAAKCYFDYIDWVPTDASYKVRNTTATGSVAWSERCFTNGTFLSMIDAYNSSFITTSFGNSASENITVIAMDSSSAEGHYNELRKLYCYDYEASDPGAAAITPSSVCYNYSDSQVYLGRYQDGNGITNYMPVLASMLEEQMLQRHYLGDMRLPTTLSLETNNKGVELQMIEKSYYAQDIIIYRTAQVYLRMAEALNYAGFPKFALAILTTGLDNNVIEHDVLSQVNTAADSAFINYFDFNTNYYPTRIQSYTTGGYILRSDNETNQVGLHSRGSGWTAFNNPYYYPADTDIPTDSTGYPATPPSYYPATARVDSLLMDSIYKYNTVLIEDYAIPAGIIPPVRSDYATIRLWNDASKAYRDTLTAYANTLYLEWVEATRLWYRDYAVPQVKARQTVVVDSLIDIEQALETCFEGHRFGDLMRAAYRKGDPSYLANRVAKRNNALGSVLLDKNRWFISWKGQIGSGQ